MSDLLFDVPVTLSPRLKWMQEHDVRVLHDDAVEIGDEDECSGETLYPWCAFTGEQHFPRPDAGYGNTEDEALASLAKRKGWRLWNEEGL